MDSLPAVVISSFWLFLPAGIANMVPVFFAKVPFLGTPIDFNKKLFGSPIFGSHKTYRGFLVGVIFAVATVFLQKLVYPTPEGYTLVDYSEVNAWQLGFLMGFGALGGDLVKSFFKRRLKIPSGWAWAPFDQIDWIIGAVLLSSIVIDFDKKYVLTAIILFGLLHPVVNLMGYFLKIKPNKF